MPKRLKNLLFIMLLGSVCAFALLAIRDYTAPKILKFQEAKLKSTILEAAGIDYAKEGLDDAFGNNIRQIEAGGFKYYLAPEGIYIFEFTGRGLWGMIEGVAALQKDGQTIKSIRIISQEETPGLGGRISEEAFLRQFINKKVSPRLTLALRRKAEAADEVDSISGATMTSNALINMINASVIDFRKLIETNEPN